MPSYYKRDKSSDDWETPSDLFNELNKKYSFTLDVSATQLNKKCERFFSIENCGLLGDWENHVCWMNPPYSNIRPWVQKASNHRNIVVALLPAKTDVKWFHDFVYRKHEIEFLKGRVKFSGSKINAPFPSMLVFFNLKDPFLW